MTKSTNYFSRVLGAFLLCAGFVLAGCIGETMSVPVTGVTLDTERMELVEGETGLLNATISPSNATNKNLLWISSNSSIVTVSEGVVSALKPGSAKVTVKTDDGGKIAICAVVVKSKDEGENEGNNDGNESGEVAGPLTWSLGKVTATTATFTGHLDVPASDLSFSQVTVYYSDAETFNLNSAQSVSATSFDNQQNYTITLTNLKYNTKYNYCMVAEVKSEKTYGDVLDFTTGDVTLLELSVVPSGFKAEVSGFVTGLSEEDKEYIKVGVLYSSESGKVENGEGKKIEATEISADGVFSVLFSDLTIVTKYYYCSYVKQDGSYTYGTPADFTTLKHPYELSYDLNVASATDLSSSGSANCYIISESGLYKFKPVKGNSNESVGSVASASLLWETFGGRTAPMPSDLIRGFCYKDGYIVIQTADTFKEGNAVIAAKDADGNILWSWHIWFTDQPQGQEYYNNAGTMMDRNLGATSATPYDVEALGLLYQWGRKDPFLGSSSISSDYTAKSTIAWPFSVSSDSSNGTIAYATANPTTFITYNRNNQDWYYTGSSSTDNTRWTTSDKTKSIYDPCPSGWRVPDGGSTGVWAKAIGSSSSFNNANGENLSVKTQDFGSASTIWYPASGVLSDSGLYNVGNYGGYWSASPDGSNDVYGLYIDCDGDVRPSYSYNRSGGRSVRCIQVID